MSGCTVAAAAAATQLSQSRCRVPGHLVNRGERNVDGVQVSHSTDRQPIESSEPLGSGRIVVAV